MKGAFFCGLVIGIIIAAVCFMIGNYKIYVATKAHPGLSYWEVLMLISR